MLRYSKIETVGMFKEIREDCITGWNCLYGQIRENTLRFSFFEWWQHFVHICSYLAYWVWQFLTFFSVCFILIICKELYLVSWIISEKRNVWKCLFLCILPHLSLIHTCRKSPITLIRKNALYVYLSDTRIFLNVL